MQVPLLRHLRRNAVAYLALFVALGGTSFAAATAITGKDVKNSSLTGKDVKNKSLTKKDFRGSVRGPRGFRGRQGPQGPQGPQGLQGLKGDPGAPGTIPGLVTTNGTVKLSVGESKTIWAYGPFTVTGTCTDLTNDNFRITLSAASTEANSALYGTEGTSNPDVDSVEDTTFASDENTNIDFAAPSGAALDVMVHIGVHGVGADCWVAGFGIGQG